VIALQETLLRSTDFGISIPSYQCFSSLGHTAAARRGVSVLIRSSFGGEPVGPAHANWVFVRVSGQEIVNPTIIGSVHRPAAATDPFDEGIGYVCLMRSQKGAEQAKFSKEMLERIGAVNFQKAKDLEAKQLHMVGYLCELVHDLALAPGDDVSQSPGFETPLGIFGGADQ
jgi:hypothetical protein